MYLLPISETATNSATNFLSAYCLYSTRHLDFYQDAIFDTKKKALPGVELPKRAKNKDFQQILGLLEVLFRYAIVWQVVTEVTGHAAY